MTTTSPTEWNHPPRAVRIQDVLSRRVTNPRLHAAIYRATGGRLGARIPGVAPPVALLTTTGRRSGASRTTPVICFRDGDRHLVAATNGGSGDVPDWLANLRHDGAALLRIGRDETAVTATEALGEDRQRLWEAMIAQHPLFDVYQRRVRSPIPVVVLMERTAPLSP